MVRYGVDRTLYIVVQCYGTLLRYTVTGSINHSQRPWEDRDLATTVPYYGI